MTWYRATPAASPAAIAASRAARGGGVEHVLHGLELAAAVDAVHEPAQVERVRRLELRRVRRVRVEELRGVAGAADLDAAPEAAVRLHLHVAGAARLVVDELARLRRPAGGHEVEHRVRLVRVVDRRAARVGAGLQPRVDSHAVGGLRVVAVRQLRLVDVAEGPVRPLRHAAVGLRARLLLAGGKSLAALHVRHPHRDADGVVREARERPVVGHAAEAVRDAVSIGEPVGDLHLPVGVHRGFLDRELQSAGFHDLRARVSACREERGHEHEGGAAPRVQDHVFLRLEHLLLIDGA